jgi:hypothetical protein
MRIALLGLALAVAPCAAAQARDISPETAAIAEERLSGVWAMMRRDPPESTEGPLFLDCRQHAMEIRFDRDADGRLVYESKAIGTGAAERTPEQRISRGPVRNLIANPRGPGVILVVQYDGEPRLDDEGNPVTWELILIDANTFHWQRADWPNDAFTPASHRCPEPPSSN